jgi:uncharacterized protein YndB with AHSA1/START domain
MTKRIETSIEIHRPIEQVFAFLIEPANQPEWAPGILQAQWTSDETIGVGSTYTRKTNYGGRQSESHHVVREFVPNELISTSTQYGPLEIREFFEVEAIEGGTRVTVAEEVTAPILVKPAEWVFAFMARRNFDKYGEALRDRIERSA